MALLAAADIAENLLEQGFEVEKRDINMPEAIRNTGEYEITVSLICRGCGSS